MKTTLLKYIAMGWLPLGLILLLVLASAGCRMVRSDDESPDQAVSSQNDKLTVDPVEVQHTLLRFAGEFSESMIGGVNQLRKGTNVLAATEILDWKIAIGTETCSIVSGPNPIGNMLDMVTFVSVTRKSLEKHWLPTVYGKSARPMLDSCRNAEQQIWMLAGRALTPEQLIELSLAIDEWYQKNPSPETVLAARAVGFSSQGLKVNLTTATKPGSVFNLLMIDPLSGMEPATREIAQARLFAERALYVTQKMPQLLRWQTELLSLNTTQMPAVQQIVTNSTEIASSLERFASVAEKLPEQVSQEREEILRALESQEKNLMPLLEEANELLATGTGMSTSLNTTLTTFDTLMNRFDVGETKQSGPPGPQAEPFRIKDYTATIAQLETTAQQLTELLVALDHTAGPVFQEAQAGSKEVVDHIFWKSVLFVSIVLAAALIYRFLAARLVRPTHHK